MNYKQYKEFAHIVQQCESGEYRNINVGSKVRRDVIVAAWHELNVRSIESRQLRRALWELEKAADLETNMSMIPMKYTAEITLLFDALQQARAALEGPIIVRKGIINGESKLRSDVVVAWEERAHLYGALRELTDASSSGDGARFSIAVAEARNVLGDNE